MKGVDKIKRQREHQIFNRNRSVEYDKKNNMVGQLAYAASLLLAKETQANFLVDVPVGWNRKAFERLMKKSYEERLEIAGALIAAELDRVSED